jgi:hypothetical protein
VREEIYQALFSLLQQVTGAPTCSRHLLHWSDVAPAAQPALYLTTVGEGFERIHGLPPKRVLRARVWLYTCSSPNLATPPSTQINELLDAIEAALAPTEPSPDGLGMVQTLGGLVYHCWIEGNIETDEGYLGSQGVCVIPISILVP